MNNDETNQVTSSSEDGVNGGSGSSEQDEQGSNESDESSESDSNKKQTSGGIIADDYQDYSRLPPLAQNPADVKGTSSKEPTFPVKLHMILSNPEHEDIIAWLPHGRSWRVLKQKEFQDKVIPLYFRHGRYASFARQVNGWGFKRIMSGCDYNSYYHPMFLRGLPHLTERIKRLTPKDMAARQEETPGPPPDFYAISRKHPLPDSSPATTSSAAAAVRLPPAFASASAAAPRINGGQPAPSTNTELQELEKRRMDLLGRLNQSISGNQPSNAPNMSAMATPAYQSQSNANNASNAGGPGMGGSIQALLSLVGNNSQQKPVAPPPPTTTQGPPDVMALLEKLLTLSSQLPNGVQSLIELVQILSQDNRESQQAPPVNPVQPPRHMAPPPPALPQSSDGSGLAAALMQLAAMNGGNANNNGHGMPSNNAQQHGNHFAPPAQAPGAPPSMVASAPMGFPPNLGALLGQNAPSSGFPAAPTTNSNTGNYSQPNQSSQNPNDLLNSILSSLQPGSFGS